MAIKGFKVKVQYNHRQTQGVTFETEQTAYIFFEHTHQKTLDAVLKEVKKIVAKNLNFSNKPMVDILIMNDNYTNNDFMRYTFDYKNTLEVRVFDGHEYPVTFTQEAEDNAKVTQILYKEMRMRVNDFIQQNGISLKAV